MTPEQVRLVSESFSRVQPRLNDVGFLLYSKLFELAPETRDLFPGEMSDQYAKLGKVLAEFVRLRTRSSLFLPVSQSGGHAVLPGIEGLRVAHARFSLTSRHFEVFGQALRNAIHILDAKANDATLEAWMEIYQMFVEALTAHVSMSAPTVHNFAAKVEKQAKDGGDEGSVDKFFGARTRDDPNAKT